MRGLSIPVHVESDLPVTEMLIRLERSFDKPLETRDIWGTVENWTVFGDVRGNEVRAETAGAFHGWAAMNGMGVWQPLFKGTVRPALGGSMLTGSVGLRKAFVLFVGFTLVWGGSVLAGLMPPAIGDAIGGNLQAAAVRAVAILLLVVIPAVGILFVWRLGLREAYALRSRLENALQHDPRGP